MLWRHVEHTLSQWRHNANIQIVMLRHKYTIFVTATRMYICQQDEYHGLHCSTSQNIDQYLRIYEKGNHDSEIFLIWSVYCSRQAIQWPRCRHQAAEMSYRKNDVSHTVSRLSTSLLWRSQMLKGSCKIVKVNATNCSLVGDHKNYRVYKCVVYRSALDHILDFQHCPPPRKTHFVPNIKVRSSEVTKFRARINAWDSKEGRHHTTSDWSNVGCGPSKRPSLKLKGLDPELQQSF